MTPAAIHNSGAFVVADDELPVCPKCDGNKIFAATRELEAVAARGPSGRCSIVRSHRDLTLRALLMNGMRINCVCSLFGSATSGGNGRYTHRAGNLPRCARHTAIIDVSANEQPLLTNHPRQNCSERLPDSFATRAAVTSYDCMGDEAENSGKHGDE